MKDKKAFGSFIKEKSFFQFRKTREHAPGARLQKEERSRRSDFRWAGTFRKKI